MLPTVFLWVFLCTSYTSLFFFPFKINVHFINKWVVSTSTWIIVKSWDGIGRNHGPFQRWDFHVEPSELFTIDRNAVSTLPETTAARTLNNDLVCSLSPGPMPMIESKLCLTYNPTLLLLWLSKLLWYKASSQYRATELECFYQILDSYFSNQCNKKNMNNFGALLCYVWSLRC